MDFLQEIIFYLTVVTPIAMIYCVRKAKRAMEDAVVENMQKAHKNLPLNNDIYWIKEISREELCCPLTHEQLEEIKKCDSIKTYDVNIHVMKSSVLLHNSGYVYMTVSINFDGWQRENQKGVRIKIDGARVMARYEIGNPGRVLKSVKRV